MMCGAQSACRPLQPRAHRFQQHDLAAVVERCRVMLDATRNNDELALLDDLLSIPKPDT